VAICGTGMGSLAGLVHARGVKVTGSDEHPYPPMSTALERWKIPVQKEFHAENVLRDAPDLVVIGNAVRPDNPEARAAIDEGLPVLSFPEALRQLAIAHKHPVVVTGTHGKTTTTALVAWLLEATGREPSLLVGGYSLDFDGSFREAGGEHFVVEGDEYDTVFFDKTPKFLHYEARTAVMTSIEFDHADIYRDLDHVKEAFRALVAQLPEDGTLVAALRHPAVREVVGGAPCRVVGYGLGEAPGPAWRARGLQPGPDGTDFELLRDGSAPLRCRIPMHGDFNVENALAALAAVDALGVPIEESLGPLARFRGVKRRQEIRGEARGVLVVGQRGGPPGALSPPAPGRRLRAAHQHQPPRHLPAALRRGLRRGGPGGDLDPAGGPDLQRHRRGHGVLLRRTARRGPLGPGPGRAGPRGGGGHRRAPGAQLRVRRPGAGDEQRRLREHLGAPAGGPAGLTAQAVSVTV
jgi:UDP-N-acetylmuramate: L-alanyl-gamma-D-glutamyl-meso-diaminopimelate ligase